MSLTRSRNYVRLALPVLSLACLLVPAALAQKADKPEYVSVKITQEFDGKTRQTRVATINDAKYIAKLMEYFPGLKPDAKAEVAGAWDAEIVIEFTRADGTVLKVTSEYKHWSVGHGDFAVKGELLPYVNKLIVVANTPSTTSAPTTTSAPAGEERS